MKWIQMHPNTTKRNRTWVQGPMGWIGCVFVKTSDATLWHELLHYLHQFSPFCIEFTVVTKHSQMHQNTMKRTKTWGYGPMGWIGCARCEKLQRDFVAWTFALIAPVQPVLHRVNCRNKTIPNAPEHYETRQNFNFGSYGLDRVCSLRKILMQLRGTNFCINFINSAHFAQCFVQ